MPAAGYHGPDSFTYMAKDAYGNSTSTMVTINVDAPPVAVSDTYSTPAGSTLKVTAADGVLRNDSDAENDALTAVKRTNPKHGRLTTFAAGGSFTYVPAAGYQGLDSFTYLAKDIDGNSNVATVTIHVGIQTSAVLLVTTAQKPTAAAQATADVQDRALASLLTALPEARKPASQKGLKPFGPAIDEAIRLLMLTHGL